MSKLRADCGPITRLPNHCCNISHLLRRHHRIDKFKAARAPKSGIYVNRLNSFSVFQQYLFAFRYCFYDVAIILRTVFYRFLDPKY